MDINIDFDSFDTHNVKTLGISDTSHYHTSTFTNSELTIKIPGYRLPVKVKFTPNRINILNSNNLALTTVQNPKDLSQLPDGLYEITLNGNISGVVQEVSKSIFRIEQLNIKFQNSVLKLKMNNCEIPNKDVTILMNIQFLIYSSIANANICRFDNAISLYQSASNQLDKFLNC